MFGGFIVCCFFAACGGGLPVFLLSMGGFVFFASFDWLLGQIFLIRIHLTLVGWVVFVWRV